MPKNTMDLFLNGGDLEGGVDPMLLQFVGLHAQLHAVFLSDVIHELDVVGLDLGLTGR